MKYLFTESYAGNPALKQIEAQVILRLYLDNELAGQKLK